MTGYDGNNNVLYPTVQESNVFGLYQTYNFNWTGVTRVHLAVSGSILGSNQVYIDNLHCTKQAPEPSTLAMACIGAVGMIVFTRQRRA